MAPGVASSVSSTARWLLLLLGLLLLASCKQDPAKTTSSCQQDADCANGICFLDTCYEACSDQDDCAVNEFCVEETDARVTAVFCRPASDYAGCRADADCANLVAGACRHPICDKLKKTCAVTTDADGASCTVTEGGAKTPGTCQAGVCKAQAGVDADGDGHGPLPYGDDCTDHDEPAYPGAPERCNGAAADCDGQSDEGLDDRACQVDNAFGTCTGTETCRGAAGWACDAAEPMPEDCNGADDDCDGATDEVGDLDATWAPAVGEAYSPKLAAVCEGWDDAIHMTGACAEPGALWLECKAGVWFCRYHEWHVGTSLGAANATSDIVFDHDDGSLGCDNVDNDCDGLTDEAGNFDGLGQPCDGDDLGACAEGTWICDAPPKGAYATVQTKFGTTLTCQEEPGDDLEICDDQNLDDDCDGFGDLEEPQFADKGSACAAEWYSCTFEGTWICSPDDPEAQQLHCTAEEAYDAFMEAVYESIEATCDGQDNDCDGATDGFYVSGTGFRQPGEPCDGDDEDACEGGTWTCRADKTGLECAGDDAVAETCNGLDDDCDGLTDEDWPLLGQGCDSDDEDLCASGSWTCATSGAELICVGDTPSPELCNGADDDCDSDVDEGFDLGGACEGVGACPTGVIECDGSGGVRCSSDPGGSAHVAVTETCNGADDDCDGATDEGFDVGQACTALGACGAGEWECDGQGGRMCSSAPSGSADASAAESCNQLDDDCDGDTDEDGVCDGEICDNGVDEGEGDGLADCLDPECKDDPACAADEDGDGFSTAMGDCDDADPDRHPGHVDLCDGKDNDCNAATPADGAGCLTCADWVIGTAPGAIQAGIEALGATGGVLCVPPGTYTEQLDWKGFPVRVVGVSGLAATTLVNPSTTPPYGYRATATFESGEGEDSGLQGFTLAGSEGSPYHEIAITSASPRIRDVRIRDATSGGYGVVTVVGYPSAAAPVLTNVAIHGCTAGAIVFVGGGDSEPLLRNVSLVGNTSSGSHQAVVAMSGSWVTCPGLDLENVTIAGNEGTAISQCGDRLKVRNVTIVDNRSNFGAAGIHGGSTSPNLANLILSGNVADAYSLGTGAAHDGIPLALDAGAILRGIFAHGNWPMDYTFRMDQNTQPHSLPGNGALAPAFVDTFDPDPTRVNLRLSAESLLIDRGAETLPDEQGIEQPVLDPDGSRADPGAFGGPGAGGFDRDGDGYPAWWKPGPYVDDSGTWHCDDGDPAVHPGAAGTCMPCTPQCGGKACGADGCGGMCGDPEIQGLGNGGCAAGFTCQGSACESIVGEACALAGDEDGDGTAGCGEGDLPPDPECQAACADWDRDGHEAPADCDDTDPAVHRGAYEVCDNGRDDDCDGATDAADPQGCVTCEVVVPSSRAPTIQSGLFAADALGVDTVCVRPGTYHEVIGWYGLGVRAVGLGGPALTHLTGIEGGEGTYLGSISTFVHGEPETAGLEGFTLRDTTAALHTGNYGQGEGGAIFVQGGTPTFRRLVVRGCVAAYGGAVSVYVTGSARFEDVWFHDNHASVGTQQGVGGAVHSSTAETLALDRVACTANGANNDGSALYATHPLTWTNGLIMGQGSRGGPAARAVKGGGTFAHLTAVRNGPFEGQGQNTGTLHIGYATLSHAIVAYNESPTTGGVSGATNLLYSDVFGNTGADLYGTPTDMTGTVSVAPGFLSLAGDEPLAWHVQLAADSPLIDQGDPSAAPDADGSVADMGAYGGPGGALWDADGDGYFSWWKPGGYSDPANWDENQHLDCDDFDASVHPGNAGQCVP